MPAHMAGGMQRLNHQVADGQPVAIDHQVIGGKTRVHTFAAALKPGFDEALHQSRAARLGPTEGIGRSTGLGRNTGHKGGMVKMGMCCQNGVDHLAGVQGRQNCGKMRRIIGPGIDQGDAASAQKIAVRARPGHG